MKTFKDILVMTQAELKMYLKKFLSSKGYKAVGSDGFLYAKGEIPVLLTAHLDKTPNVGGKPREQIEEIHRIPTTDAVGNVTTRISSPQGIGGDDRCGVWIIMNAISKGLKPSVLFCEDEEVGSRGATKFVSHMAKKDSEVELDGNLKFMVEIDRRGKNDAVYYSCDNKDFVKWVEENTGYKKEFGSMSDISVLMPALKLAAVNFSCGYYNEHTLAEYVVEEHMNRTMDMIIELLKNKVTEDTPKFEYVRKVFDSYSYYGGSLGSYYGGGEDYEDDDDYMTEYYSKYFKSTGHGDSTGAKKSSTVTSIKSKSKGNSKSFIESNTSIALTVFLDDDYGFGNYVVVRGNTKPDCWMTLFFDYPELCFSMIEEYEWE